MDHIKLQTLAVAAVNAAINASISRRQTGSYDPEIVGPVAAVLLEKALQAESSGEVKSALLEK